MRLISRVVVMPAGTHDRDEHEHGEQCQRYAKESDYFMFLFRHECGLRPPKYVVIIP